MTSPEVSAQLCRAGGPALADHVARLVATAQDSLAGTLTAAYVVGSIASGDARAQASDLDLMLVTPRRWDPEALRSAGCRMADDAAAGPLRGLEAVLYRSQVLAAPAYPLMYELNVNSGRRMPRIVATEGGEPFWFLLDVAAAREHALVIHGPPVAALVPPVPEAHVLEALGDSLRWHADEGGSGPDAVLNTCRAWHWLERRSWLSKTTAGTWALGQPSAPPIIEAALAARRGASDDALDTREVRRFARTVARSLGAARRAVR